MTAADRQALAAELLRKVAAAGPANAAIEDLKIRLREAGAADGSFSERVEGLGQVEVAAPKGKRFKGTMPTLVPDLYLAMTEAERAGLAAAGVVVLAEQYSRPFAGSVTVKLA